MPEVLRLGHSDLSQGDKPLCKLKCGVMCLWRNGRAGSALSVPLSVSPDEPLGLCMYLMGMCSGIRLLDFASDSPVGFGQFINPSGPQFPHLILKMGILGVPG